MSLFLTKTGYINMCVKCFREHLEKQLEPLNNNHFEYDKKKKTPTRIPFSYQDKQNNREDEGFVEFHVYL